MTDLPFGWEATTTAALLNFVTSGSRGWARYYSHDGALFIRVGNLRRGSIVPDLSDVQRVSPPERAEGSRTRVAPNDILISITADLGRIALMANVDEPTYINQHVALARPAPGVNPNYLAWYLTSEAVQQQWARQQRGVTKLGLGLDDIRLIETPLAPAAEQARIVAAIEEEFSLIDAGVAALERVRQNLKRMRAAVLETALSSTQHNGAMPVALGDLVMPGKKASYGVLVPGDDVPGGVPFVRVGDLSDRRINTASLKRISPAIAARYPRTCLHGGEVLLSLVGTIGRTAVVPPELAGANTARALAVLPLREGVDPRYVAIALSPQRVTADLTNLSHEVARKTLNLEDVRKYAIPVPSHTQQLEIVEYVDTAEMGIAALEHLVTSASRRSGNLYSSILAMAFSGKLVRQDPNDEPAGVLLERMAEEDVARKGYEASSNRPHRTKVTA